MPVLVMIIMAAAWWGWPGLGLLAFFTAGYAALALLGRRNARRQARKGCHAGKDQQAGE
jgi:hypothetical protein